MFQNNRQVAWLRMLDPAFIPGVLCTLAFYWMVHQPSMHDTMLYRYTTEHAVEYAIVALFIWGSIDILLKFLSFPKELFSLQQEWLPHRAGREPAAQAGVLLEQVRARPRWLRESKIGRRFAAALDYVIENGSAENYREHLQYLSDQDADSAHARDTLIRFIVAVSPILGFLGTVVHFGTALTGFSFDEMTDRLPEIVGEMGAALNTTTVALATAMSMMFALFLSERIERGLLSSIDRLVERDLLNRFEVRDANVTPFLATLTTAHHEALQAIGATVQKQSEAWTRTLDALFQRFDARQQVETRTWNEALQILQQRHVEYDNRHAERFRESLVLVESWQGEHMHRIQATLDRAVSLREDFAELGKTLNGIARGEGKLVELQAALSTNLRVLHETQQIDEALHGLTAAIHLLTVRHRQTDQQDSIAA